MKCISLQVLDDLLTADRAFQAIINQAPDSDHLNSCTETLKMSLDILPFINYCSHRYRQLSISSPSISGASPLNH